MGNFFVQSQHYRAAYHVSFQCREEVVLLRALFFVSLRHYLLPIKGSYICVSLDKLRKNI